MTDLHHALEEERRTLLNLIADAWDDGNATGLDGYAGPGRGEAGGPDQEAEDIRDRFIRKAQDKLDALPLRNAQVAAVLKLAEEMDRRPESANTVDHYIEMGFQLAARKFRRAIEEAGA